ncbi:MAG: hypothetical protein ACR2GH_07145 [Pseudonocardia sp.]
MPRYERTLKILGGLRTHLLGTAISLINGCSHCTYADVYAFQLIYLRERGAVFPLDEHEVGQLCGQAPAVIRNHLIKALKQADLYSEVWWLNRTIELTLAEDRRPTEADDIRLAHLVRMIGVLNSVGIASQTPPDEAHDRVNRDDALKLRYAGLRASAAI